MLMIIIPSISTLCIFSYAFKLQKQYEKMMITTLYDGFHYINQHKEKMQKEENTNMEKHLYYTYLICQNDCLSPYSAKLVQRKSYIGN